MNQVVAFIGPDGSPLQIPVSAENPLPVYAVGGTPGGGGDVNGPASAVPDNLAAFADGTGKLLKDSGLALANIVTAASAFSNDNRLLRSDGTGKGSQAGPLICDDSGNVLGLATITFTDLVLRRVDANKLALDNGTPGTLRDLQLRNLFLGPDSDGVEAKYSASAVYGEPGVNFRRSGDTLDCSISVGHLLAWNTVYAAGTLTIGGGTPIAKIRSATATLDFGSILAAASEDKTITVTDAAVGDRVVMGLPATVLAGAIFNAWVSAADTVTIRCNNAGSIAIDPASATYAAMVVKF